MREHDPVDTTAAPPGPAAAVLDAKALARLRELDADGRKGFVPRVLETFLGALDRQVRQIDAAGGAGDWQTAGTVAHGLKSSSAQLGALDLSALAAEIESLSRRGATAALPGRVAALRAESLRVAQAVRAMLSTPPEP